MQIVIPSHKRSHRMTTWKNLPGDLRHATDTRVCVYPDEVQDYPHFPLLITPHDMPKGIANKRNFILQQCKEDHLLILDDDLVFAKRRKDEPTKFSPCAEIDVIEMVSRGEDMLNSEYVHGGIAGREGGNRDINEFKFNTRVLRAHFFNARELKRIGFVLNDTLFMSDFDSTLKLLEASYPNFLLNNWVTNQHGSNTEGGCSETRTLADLEAAAHLLEDRHPRYVTTVEKTTKSAWGGGTRTDVRIQWKKAYQESQ